MADEDLPTPPDLPEPPEIPEIPDLPDPPEAPEIPDPPEIPDIPELPGGEDEDDEAEDEDEDDFAPDSSDSAPQPGDRSSAAGDAASLPDPVGELRFQVLLDDAVIGDFAECTGLSMEYDVMEYEEGGQMGFVHKLRGRLKYPNLVLKRGVTYEDAFLKWFFDQTDRDSRGNVTLNLLGDDGKQVRTWSFASAFPVKWSGPSFNAKSTNVAMETLEIAHQGMIPPS